MAKINTLLFVDDQVIIAEMKMIYRELCTS